MRQITINGTSYNYRHTWGAVYYFESAVTEAFDPTKHAHLHLMYYCQLLAANPDTFTLTQDDFIAALNEAPALAKELDAAFLAEMEWWGREEVPTVEQEEGRASKKKKRRR